MSKTLKRRSAPGRRSAATALVAFLTLAALAVAGSVVGSECDDVALHAADGVDVSNADRAGAGGTVGRSAPAESAKPAPRIAALLPFAADQLIAMGVRPVAVPTLRGEVPSAWDGIETIALDHSAGPNMEQLIAAAPDVIITSAVYAQFVAPMQQATKARVIVMDVESVASVREHVATLAEVTGRRMEGERILSGVEAALPKFVGARAPAATPDSGGKSGASDPHGASGSAAPLAPLDVLAVFGTPHAFYAFLPDSYLGDLVALSGGELITKDMKSHPVFRGLAPLSMEVVVDRDPDLLIVVFHGSEDAARSVLERDPLWAKLTAVKRGAVVFLNDDLYAMRPGSEMPRAMREIETILADARTKLQ